MRGLRLPALLVLAGFLLLAGPAKERRGVIHVPLWVDSGSDPLPVLNPADLKASLGGAPARVVAVSRPAGDLVLLMVFDWSEYLELAETARQALDTQLNGLPERTWVSLLRSQDGLRVLLDPTPDRAAALKAMHEIPVSGKAGLLETIESIQDVADSVLAKAEVRVAVIYLTDSDVGNYREDFTNPVINYSDSHDLSRRFPEQLIQEKIAKMEGRLAGGQAPIFVVHLKYRSERMNEAYQVGLKRLAEASGGSAVFCRSMAEIPDAIQKTFALIGAHYSVALELPQNPGKTVTVEMNLAGSGAQGKNISYRTRYVFK